MKLTAEEKSIENRIKNIKKNPYFYQIINEAQRISPKLVLPIRKLLICIQQIVESDEKFTSILFYYIMLYILDDYDYKCEELLELLEYIRKEVLELDIKEYHQFLKKHHIPIPKSLEDDLTNLSYLEESRNLRKFTN